MTDEEVIQIINERDRAEKALQQAHLALGGDGEWAARIPRPSPPDSGDLALDVPELATLTMSRISELEVRLRDALDAVARLKMGEFTEEEFQALCHNLREDCPKRFADGCVAYNRKLFGERSLLQTRE